MHTTTVHTQIIDELVALDIDVIVTMLEPIARADMAVLREAKARLKKWDLYSWVCERNVVKGGGIKCGFNHSAARLLSRGPSKCQGPRACSEEKSLGILQVAEQVEAEVDHAEREDRPQGHANTIGDEIQGVSFTQIISCFN